MTSNSPTCNSSSSDLKGHVDDPDDNLQSYAAGRILQGIAIVRMGTEDWETILVGSSEVSAGSVLGKLDPSTLSDDSYRIRLTATDTTGLSNSVEDQIEIVSGGLKLGNFTLSFTDLSIPISGIQITYGYDQYGRLSNKSFSDPRVATVGYTYDPITSQIKTVTDGRGVTSYGFGSYDRVNLITNPDGQTVGYTYDVLGNLKVLTTSANTVNYAYDKLNRLDTVTSGSNQVAKYGYDAVGNLVSTALGDGTTETDTYDASNRLTGMNTRDRSGAILSSYDYTLDGVGNRTKVVENGGRTVNYTFDTVNQLTQESIVDPTLGNRTIGYEYDPVGNRLKRNDSDPAGGLTTYAYDANNRLKNATNGTKVTSFTYDNNGSTLTKSDGTNTVTYDWINDGENRLIKVDNGTSQTSYVYDASGNRVASITDGVRKNYLLDTRGLAKVLQESDANGQIQTKYTFGLGLIKSESGGNTSFYHSDGLGSTRLLTDSTGQVTDRYTYDAFGRLLARGGSSSNSFQFAGEQRDGTGLDYLRARYYDSELGRFISKDAFGGRLSSPISQNPYAYANNNPINFTDPSGYFSIQEVNVTQAIIGILSNTAYASAFSGAITLVEEGYHLSKSLYSGDGRKTEIDGAKILESMFFGGLLGFGAPILGAIPKIGGPLLALLFGTLSYQAVQSAKNDWDNGDGALAVFKIGSLAAPFASKEFRDAYPALYKSFSNALAQFNIKVNPIEGGGFNIELPRYSNPEALKWQLAEEAGIPRSIDYENPNNVFGVSFENLAKHYELSGFEVVPKTPRASSSGVAQIFELPNNPIIKEVQYHPGSKTHGGVPYYKFTLRNGNEIRIIDNLDFKPGTVAPNQQYFNSNGQPIEYQNGKWNVIE
ncbi:hypothetical protein TUMEXPCC7403_18305 [Tumidithrix helvetica PCC 7403]|uniref:RHS repeat domain-containing protein n=1 Tax=Tumidithrix helvetica TaxID=3457545 RepID=UPI003CAF4FEF